MTIERTAWGNMPDGGKVMLFTLTNARGMRASVSNYGATLVGLDVPDRDGAMADVVLGYDDLESYRRDTYCMGRIVGRTAGRIRDARFVLGNMIWSLDRNHGEHHIHGGRGGFHARLWNAETAETKDGPAVFLTYESEHHEEGYPGKLFFKVAYTLTVTGLRLWLSGMGDSPTVVNVTNHAYFNLGGHGGGDILDHTLELNAPRYLECDASMIPTGRILDTAKTPLEFSRPMEIGARIKDEALGGCGGYDHYFLLDGIPGELNPAARLYHPDSGRLLEVFSTQPGLQVYTANFLPDGLDGKAGAVYGKHCGICLETQGCPDAPNQPEFPSVVLRPGEKYEQTTEYRFPIG
ncbi:aldose epimerase family protein [uncultured Pseudodesulfovibrio sp.]|uniref:aldose epimerase family protein n=1 Tax=uncultured Pseudodesulfovibrio sp. TaxID=2035858 RepID=UPI0029C91ADC|nr:aldose epimerase family protein [uncultured Pseudodesulfovibrio sp.]